MSLNKVMLIGNLGRDAELRYTPGGVGVATFSMATTDKWTDKAGARQERTEWHRVVLWGKLAESVSEYLTKGKQVYIEGKLNHREYEKDGEKKYITEVRADKLTLLGGGTGGGGGGAREREQQANETLTDDDIPF